MKYQKKDPTENQAEDQTGVQAVGSTKDAQAGGPAEDKAEGPAEDKAGGPAEDKALCPPTDKAGNWISTENLKEALKIVVPQRMKELGIRTNTELATRGDFSVTTACNYVKGLQFPKKKSNRENLATGLDWDLAKLEGKLLQLEKEIKDRKKKDSPEPPGFTVDLRGPDLGRVVANVSKNIGAPLTIDGISLHLKVDKSTHDPH